MILEAAALPLLQALRRRQVAPFALDDVSGIPAAKRASFPPQPAPHRQAHGEDHAERERREHEHGEEKQRAQHEAQQAMNKGHGGMIGPCGCSSMAERQLPKLGSYRSAIKLPPPGVQRAPRSKKGAA